MSAWHIIVRSLLYHWRINLAVALGVAAATAVLTGALLVGDSVRGSLKQLTLERLGAIDHVLVADRYFRAELAEELAAQPKFDEYFSAVVPALIFPAGTVERMGERGLSAEQRAAGVLVVGAGPGFWDLGADERRPVTPPGKDQIVLNQPLADELTAFQFAVDSLEAASLRQLDDGRLPDALRRAFAENDRQLSDEARVSALSSGSRWRIESGNAIFTAGKVDSKLNVYREVGVGDLISLRLPKATQVHGESILGEKSDRIRGITRLEVVDIIPAEGLGRFSLEARQTTPLNAYVNLETLQGPLDEYGNVNSLLVAGKPPLDKTQPGAAKALAEVFQPRLEDYGYQLKRVRRVFPPEEGGPALTDRQDSAPAGEEASGGESTEESTEDSADQREVIYDYYSLSTDRMFFSPAAARVARAAFEEQDAQPILTYLANAIGVVRQSEQDEPRYDEQDEIPYSTVSAISGETAERILRAADGSPLRLDSEGIVLNSWTAEQLGAEVGDTIRLKYFEPETEAGEYVERSADFALRGIAPLTEPARPYTRRRDAVYEEPPTAVNDPNLTPDVEGVTDQESIESWDVPFPMTRPILGRDDQYWKNHRTTPKAFVSLERGQELWGTERFGQVTSFRIPAEGVESAEQLAASFLGEARRQGVPLGLAFQPIKQKALAASAGTTPFDGLFLGLSLFIIAAALMLVALLFRLGVEQRAHEVGILLAVGTPRRRAAWLLTAEGVLVAAAGAVLGVAAGVAYSRAMLAGLQSWWLGAVVTRFLEFHWQPTTLLLGYVLGVVICGLTILLSVRQLRKLSNRQLLAGQAHEAGGLAGGSRRWPPWVAGGLILLSAGLGTTALFVGGETQAGCFVGAGASLLAALLLLIWSRLRSSTTGDAMLGHFVPVKLAARSAARNPGRSTLTIGLLGSASFLIVAMSSFRMAPSESGVGGFQLLARSGQPIFEDLSTREGREKLLGSRADALRDVTILPLRLRPGDDASCNNLYRPTQPQILGVGETLMSHFDNPDVPHFRWADTAAESPEEERNPWRLLQRDAEDEVIPVVLDKDTAMWSLRLYWGVGEEFEVEYADGTRVRFRVAGLLSKSVLQGSLLIGERHFLERFPEVAGDRFFLIRTPPGREQEVVSVLETGLSDRGFDAKSSYQILEGLLAVQNTYLSTFQSLGALGLLLGTFGLATVQLRSVLERRGELALLRTTGFRRRRLAMLVLLENTLLLLAGLATGVIAALVAVLPHMLLGAASIPWSLVGELALTLVVVLVVGILSGLAAVRATLRAPLLEALREE